MKARTLVAVLVVCLAAAICFAASPWIGTWKLNESKSKIPAGADKNSTVVYTASGDSTTVTVDGMNGSGAATHNEWTGKFDGKPYAITGDPTADMRAYTMVDANTLTFTNTKGGKVVLTGRIHLSADGKTRTVTTTATDSMGMKTTSTAVYDKQ
jgi:hypothetical protein